MWRAASATTRQKPSAPLSSAPAAPPPPTGARRDANVTARTPSGDERDLDRAGRLVSRGLERFRHVAERELVRGQRAELVAPTSGETGGGGEFGLTLARAVAERSEQRDLL